MIKKMFLAAVLSFGVAGAAQAQSLASTVPSKPVAAATNPDVKAWVTEANKARDAKEFGKAVELYNKILKADPNNPDMIYGFAYIANEYKDYNKAIDWANRGISQNPKCAYYIVELAYANWKLGNTAAAKSQLIEANTLDPKFGQPYDYMIEILKAEGDMETAKKVEELKKQHVKA